MELIIKFVNYFKRTSKDSFKYKVYLLIFRIYHYILPMPIFRLHRMLPARLGFGVFPDFLILGAQKAGTSSLYQFLAYHPEIKTPTIKETNFFTQDFHRGLVWYQSYFPASYNKHKQFLTGEASTTYLYVPYVPQLVADALPKAKFIVLLRNPIERAFSHYQHNWNLNIENLSFEEAVKCEDDRIRGELEIIMDGHHIADYRTSAYLNFAYVSRGKYAIQLQQWFKVFSRDQFLVLKFEEFFSNPQEHYPRVLDFLGVKEVDTAQFPRRNIGAYKSSLDPETRKRLHSIFNPLNKQLGELIDMDVDDWV